MATLDSVDVGDHVCWLVAPGDDYHGTARSYLAGGERVGDKMLVIGTPRTRWLEQQLPRGLLVDPMVERAEGAAVGCGDAAGPGAPRGPDRRAARVLGAAGPGADGPHVAGRCRCPGAGPPRAFDGVAAFGTALRELPPSASTLRLHCHPTLLVLTTSDPSSVEAQTESLARLTAHDTLPGAADDALSTAAQNSAEAAGEATAEVVDSREALAALARKHAARREAR
ncbi:hypothetical protein [Streptacidiphilus sp. P02-A3a]|uniref:hypothetical protein n=1 Tax=Streptacidiphilus sp. P02-A3a TaxID=2704468 RepID=UPI0015FD843F|nr:hypothetical protein [Streptacidiphilus sp. P02-A3a]QMU73396.1 hypothetical protein GXP74_39430 [Streptacidiphilus sp. P02-A3a]